MTPHTLVSQQQGFNAQSTSYLKIKGRRIYGNKIRLGRNFVTLKLRNKNKKIEYAGLPRCYDFWKQRSVFTMRGTAANLGLSAGVFGEIRPTDDEGKLVVVVVGGAGWPRLFSGNDLEKDERAHSVNSNIDPNSKPRYLTRTKPRDNLVCWNNPHIRR